MSAKELAAVVETRSGKRASNREAVAEPAAPFHWLEREGDIRREGGEEDNANM